MKYGPEYIILINEQGKSSFVTDEADIFGMYLFAVFVLWDRKFKNILKIFNNVKFLEEMGQVML